MMAEGLRSAFHGNKTLPNNSIRGLIEDSDCCTGIQLGAGRKTVAIKLKGNMILVLAVLIPYVGIKHFTTGNVLSQ